MARKRRKESASSGIFKDLREETLRGVFAILFLVVAVFLMLAALDLAGVVGRYTYQALAFLLGIGYYLLPAVFIALALALAREAERNLGVARAVGAVLFVIAGLGLFETLFAERGGIVGAALAGPLVGLIDIYASVILLVGLLIVSLLILFDAHLNFDIGAVARSLFARRAGRENEREEQVPEPVMTTGSEESASEEDEASAQPEESGEGPEEEADEEDSGEDETPQEEAPRHSITEMLGLGGSGGHTAIAQYGHYNPPPLSILEKDRGKPGVGDTKANANIIKRTLANFGIRVEMDEITVGPTVTRYSLKPAEGVRLSKIVSLQSNLELALAASPIRIEAPIPGKALVGLEVPNTAKATIGLASLLSSGDFAQSTKPLLVTLGRDITGTAHYADLAKMPHVLIAGATNSGKSVMIHAFITSLLYRNGPDAMRFIMIDPKRVELTLYNSIPHLLTPVITDPKKAIQALKWASKEMERRYDILEAEKVRDIGSYHESVYTPARERYEKQRGKKGSGEDEDGEEDLPEPLPFIVVIIDELAELMQAYPREIEAAIVRLAQLSRAVGIHLMLSTQRPSVNVITGLIKANVPARVALQVASQIDSRTILDMGGAEKLLGAGDMLYLSGEMAKPRRIQSPLISEKEVKSIVSYLTKHNEPNLDAGIDFSGESIGGGQSSESDEGEEDDLYEEARQVVINNSKASTSLLQRKLRIGYGRAARLIDLLEERGVVGPSDGSKPREVYQDAATDEANAEAADSDDQS